MNKQIKLVIKELIENKFDLSYFKEFKIEQGYNIRLSEYFERLTIVHGNHSYIKRIQREIKIEGFEINQEYVGEIAKGTPRHQKTFLVKQTEDELVNVLKEKDPCENCDLQFATCKFENCQIIKELETNKN